MLSTVNSVDVSEGSNENGQISSAASKLMASLTKASLKVKQSMPRLSSNLKDSNAMFPGARGPSIKSLGAVDHFFKEELKAARSNVAALDVSVSKAGAFKELSIQVLEEANRALSRLEQAYLAKRADAPELIVIACEIKMAARRGHELVREHGQTRGFGRVVSLITRKSVTFKFDKVIADLKSLIPAALPVRSPPNSASLAAAIESLPHNNSAPLVTAAGVSSAKPHLTPAASAPALAPLARDSKRGLATLSRRGQQAAEAAAAGPPMGLVVRESQNLRHNETVNAVTYVPMAALAPGSHGVCIWWSVALAVEFWSEASQSSTSFTMEKSSLTVTAIGIDDEGKVWTGHQKGVLRVRRKQMWDTVMEDKCFNSAVRVIAFDDSEQAWVGDDAGRVKVLVVDDMLCRLETCATLSRALAASNGGSNQQQRTNGGGASSNDGGQGVSLGAFGIWARPMAAGRKQDGQMEGPVRAILARGQRAWVSGGQRDPWLSVFSTSTFTELGTWDCTEVGVCNAMAVLCWADRTPHDGGRHEHGAAAGASGRGGEAAPPSGTLSSASSCPLGMWRLLTGHEHGQVLMWIPDAAFLQPMLKIGDSGSPVRGIMMFPEFGLMVTGHASGNLHITTYPTPEVAWAPTNNGFSSAGCGTLKSRRATVKAHKSGMTHMVGHGSTLVTTSVAATIRLWQGRDLLAEAERLGVVAAASSLAKGFSKGSVGELLGHVSGNSNSPATPSLTSAASAAASDHVTAARRSGSFTQRTLVSPSPSTDLALEPSLMRGKHTRSASGGTVLERVSLGSTSDIVVVPGTTVGARGSEGLHTFGAAVQTIDATEVTKTKVIGHGAYGTVWLADWTGCQVAVKELLNLAMGDRDSRAWQDLVNEVHLLGSLSHPNIMRFMAVCLEPPMIVMQYYPHGSLFDLLTKARKGVARASKELTWIKRLDMLRDVAAGMHYLHTRRPTVIHGDLRSPNLLLDLTIDNDRPRFHVKIADFGLARMTQGSSMMVSKTTNPRWSAPEVIKESLVGKAADVYSFAIVMWEMLTWGQPFEEMMSIQVIFSTVAENNRPDVPDDDKLPGAPGASLQQYKDLMEKCWSSAPADRPSFKQIVDVYQSMLDVERKAAMLLRQQQQALAAAGQASATPTTSAPTAAAVGRPPAPQAVPSPITPEPIIAAEPRRVFNMTVIEEETRGGMQRGGRTSSVASTGGQMLGSSGSTAAAAVAAEMQNLMSTASSLTPQIRVDRATIDRAIELASSTPPPPASWSTVMSEDAAGAASAPSSGGRIQSQGRASQPLPAQPYATLAGSAAAGSSGASPGPWQGTRSFPQLQLELPQSGGMPATVVQAPPPRQQQLPAPSTAFASGWQGVGGSARGQPGGPASPGGGAVRRMSHESDLTPEHHRLLHAAARVAASLYGGPGSPRTHLSDSGALPLEFHTPWDSSGRRAAAVSREGFGGTAAAAGMGGSGVLAQGVNGSTPPSPSGDRSRASPSYPYAPGIASAASGGGGSGDFGGRLESNGSGSSPHPRSKRPRSVQMLEYNHNPSEEAASTSTCNSPIGLPPQSPGHQPVMRASADTQNGSGPNSPARHGGLGERTSSRASGTLAGQAAHPHLGPSHLHGATSANAPVTNLSTPLPHTHVAFGRTVPSSSKAPDASSSRTAPTSSAGGPPHRRGSTNDLRTLGKDGAGSGSGGEGQHPASSSSRGLPHSNACTSGRDPACDAAAAKAGHPCAPRQRHGPSASGEAGVLPPVPHTSGTGYRSGSLAATSHPHPATAPHQHPGVAPARRPGPKAQSSLSRLASPSVPPDSSGSTTRWGGSALPSSVATASGTGRLAPPPASSTGGRVLNTSLSGTYRNMQPVGPRHAERIRRRSVGMPENGSSGGPGSEAFMRQYHRSPTESTYNTSLIPGGGGRGGSTAASGVGGDGGEGGGAQIATNLTGMSRPSDAGMSFADAAMAFGSPSAVAPLEASMAFHHPPPPTAASFPMPPPPHADQPLSLHHAFNAIAFPSTPYGGGELITTVDALPVVPPPAPLARGIGSGSYPKLFAAGAAVANQYPPSSSSNSGPRSIGPPLSGRTSLGRFNPFGAVANTAFRDEIMAGGTPGISPATSGASSQLSAAMGLQQSAVAPPTLVSSAYTAPLFPSTQPSEFKATPAFSSSFGGGGIAALVALPGDPAACDADEERRSAALRQLASPTQPAAVASNTSSSSALKASPAFNLFGNTALPPFDAADEERSGAMRQAAPPVGVAAFRASAAYNPFGNASLAPFDSTSDDERRSAALRQVASADTKPAIAAASSAATSAFRASAAFNPFGNASLPPFDEASGDDDKRPEAVTPAPPPAANVASTPLATPIDFKASPAFNPFGNASLPPFGEASDEDERAPAVPPHPTGLPTQPGPAVSDFRASAAFNPFGAAALPAFD